MSDRVWIFDTTLRDGEQSPGCSMTVPEKLRMGAKLVELGVDILVSEETLRATRTLRYDDMPEELQNRLLHTLHGKVWGAPPQ